MSELTQLPPLTGLRAFAAAARHQSFSKAADELHVTPAALSFQIKTLEEHLGAPLFHRKNRVVELTELGRQLVPGVQDGFASLSRAWRQAKRIADSTTLTVTAGPAFTTKWLVPRMSTFAARHPEIELRVLAGLQLFDLAHDNVDVAIRFGMGGDEGLDSTPFIREWMTPMMSPALAERFRTPEDLRSATLLHQDDLRFLDPPCDWAAWFKANGLAAPPAGGPRFSQADHALDAAQAGTGVILGRISLAASALADGRLIAPFPLCLTTEAHYRLVCAPQMRERPQVAAFLDWVREEARLVTPHAEGREFVAAAEVAQSASSANDV